jgi:sulfite reductase beta subunit-like hemoprotein
MTPRAHVGTARVRSRSHDRRRRLTRLQQAPRTLVGMATAVRPNIPRAKRDGLDVDLAGLCEAGPAALEPDDHYRLKTYGVCAQRQDDRFMIRLRVAAGGIDHHQVGVVAGLARRYADDAVHLTTRQNLELHSVVLPDVPTIYGALDAAGLVGRSACGHTIRNVMACPEAGTSIDEPFDVAPDARRLSRLLVARSSELNVALPSRLNIVLGGCTTCGFDALTNDIGLVARVHDGECGYQLWAGGSLGSAPRLSMLLRPFIRRDEVWPAVWTVVEWYCREGSIDQVARGRLKFVLEERGDAHFRQAFARRFPELRAEEQPPLEPVEPHAPESLEHALALAPPQGWGKGVRPQRPPGLATVTVRVPLGDLPAGDFERVAALTPGRTIHLSRDQNIVLRSVPVERVPEIVDELAAIGLGPDGARSATDVRACPGLTFCSLAITGSQPIARVIETTLADRPDLPRDVSIAVSGCPNSCAKQQAADIGLTGTKVRLDGRTDLGYQLVIGADLPQGALGQPVLKLFEEEVPAAVTAVLEAWVALRRPSEAIAATFRRVGLERVGAAVALRLRPDADRFVGDEEQT